MPLLWHQTVIVILPTSIKRISARNGLLVLMLFLSSPLTAQLKTALLWCEVNASHYAAGVDELMKGYSGFIAYIDTSNTVTRENYLSAYYEIVPQYSRQLEGYSKLPPTVVSTNLERFDQLVNSNLAAVVRCTYNQYWDYVLCRVTYEDVYLGEIEQYLPNYNQADASPWLTYEQIPVPTYFIKLHTITPVAAD